MTRHVYPRLSDALKLRLSCPASLINATTYRDEPGHMLPVGWTLFEEIRDDLPAGDHTIVQHVEDGLVARYWVARADLEASMQVRS